MPDHMECHAQEEQATRPNSSMADQQRELASSLVSMTETVRPRRHDAVMRKESPAQCLRIMVIYASPFTQLIEWQPQDESERLNAHTVKNFSAPIQMSVFL